MGISTYYPSCIREKQFSVFVTSIDIQVMAVKTISPFKLGGAWGCIVTSGCLTVVLIAAITEKFASLCNQSYKLQGGLFTILGLLQLFNCVIMKWPTRYNNLC